MPGRYGDLDYHRLTKRSVAFGVALFAFGALGRFVGVTLFGGLAGWETLLVDVELVGVAIAFAAPFVFGIVLPLTE